MPDPATVLLVEDDHEIRRSAEVRLRSAGYRTITAENGEQGVRKAVGEHPDTIVMDVRMPVQDGMSALVELKENEATRNIPIVMLSASIVDRQRALEAGAHFFLTKPYEGTNLLATVAAAMNTPDSE